MDRRGFFGGLVGAAAASAVLLPVRPRFGPVDEGTDRMAAASAQRRRKRFPNVLLRTQENKEVRFYDGVVKDKIVLINMMYTRCKDGFCLPTTANLARVQEFFGDRLGREIVMCSITLDPEHDTPVVLRRYAANFRVRPGWHFLTGSKAAVETVRKALGFVSPVPAEDNDISNHVGVVRFGIENLELWGSCPSLTKPKWIARDVARLEAAARKAIRKDLA